MIGESVSHYRIVEELGSGGMGVVYRARDERLGREVALKFLPARLARDEAALARFDREARLASALNHPHICTVHDVGQHQGRPFIVMELCSGSTVKQLLAEGALPLEQALDVALQAAEALDAAHRRGVIHRDIKPANLFVTAGGQVKVLDFGLAKLAEARPAPDGGAEGGTTVPPEELTRPGAAIGTIAYMSPEQSLGRPVDATTDLFSLGAVLYEMATGARAFPGSTPGVVFDRILNRRPPRPSKLNPRVPAEVEALLDRLLAKAPEERCPSAAALVEELKRLKREASSGGLGPARSGSGRALVPAGAGRVVAALALLAAVLGGLLLLSRVGRPPLPLQERDAILLAGIRNETGEAVFDETLSQALAVQLSQSPFLNIVSEDPVRETLQLMGRASEDPPTGATAREVCQRLSLRAMVEGSITRLGRLYVVRVEATDCSTGRSLAREQGQAGRTEEVLDAVGSVAVALRTRLGESLRSVRRFDVPIAQATTPSLEALRAYTLGLAQRRKGAEMESIPFFERALALDPRFAAAAATLSTVYGNLGEGSRSVEYARLAYANRDRVSERERFFIVYQYHDRVSGDHLEAADTLRVWQETYRGDFRPANALALLYNRLGDFERGAEEAREALARTPGHPFALSNLAHAYRALGRDADARRVAEEAVARGVATVPTRRLLYQLAVSEGRRADAERQLEWARGRPREFDLVAARAQVAAYEGRLREADELYGETVRLAAQRGLPEAGAAYLAHQALAHALYGDRGAALALARRALSTEKDRDSTASSMPRYRAVVVLGLLGAPEAAETADEILRHYPRSTMANAVLVPTTRAAIELSQGRFAAALDALRPAATYETGSSAVLIPAYLRGEAHRRAGNGPPALAAFLEVLEHRGTDPFSPACAAARLGAARAWALVGDRSRSLAAYRELLDAWARADADLPALGQARAESAELLARRPAR
jgi:serine/threonine protein kinase/tetratricopeptide (TPR) repeat protein